MSQAEAKDKRFGVNTEKLEQNLSNDWAHGPDIYQRYTPTPYCTKEIEKTTLF